MPLNSLPHDINHLLLVAAAENDCEDYFDSNMYNNVRWLSIRSLSRTCRSLRQSFFNSKATLVTKLFPDIPSDDIPLIQRFARFLYSLGELGFLFVGSQQVVGEKFPLSFTCDEWFEALVVFATSRCSRSNSNYSRCWKAMHDPKSLTAFDLLFDLMERVGNGVFNKKKAFPLPRVEPDSQLRAELERVLDTAARKRKWEWFGKVLGVWDGIPDADSSEELDRFIMDATPPDDKALWPPNRQRGRLEHPRFRDSIRNLGFRGWEVLSWIDEDNLVGKRILFEMWWKDRRMQRTEEFCVDWPEYGKIKLSR